jgi:hypothetical protein
VFSPPRRPLAPAVFRRAVARDGLRLAPSTLMLLRRATCYVNGEATAVPQAARAMLSRLADERFLTPGTPLPAAAAALLYTWYESGYVLIGDPP